MIGDQNLRIGGITSSQGYSSKLEAIQEGAKRPGGSMFIMNLNDMGGGGPSISRRTEAVTPGAQLMARAELNPQYEADKAATSVQDKAQMAMDAENRRLSAMGIDPGSGRARTIDKNAAIALAAAKAGAANTARRGVVRDNWDRMFKAAQVMQGDRSLDIRQQQADFSMAQASQPSYRDWSSDRNATRAAGERLDAQLEERDYQRDQDYLSNLTKSQRETVMAKRSRQAAADRAKAKTASAYSNLNRKAGGGSGAYRSSFEV